MVQHTGLSEQAGGESTTPNQTPDLVTVVVGAGPAGLLFAVVARLLHDKHGRDTAWPILIVDQRDEYVRTHRLRIAPQRYLDLRDELEDPRFDELIEFLDTADFRPVVNELENRLRSLAGELGVARETLTVGDKPGELNLATLRRHALDKFGASSGTPVTIVGADSVHSAVRGSVGAPDRIQHTHQTVARFLVRGTDLPGRLSPVSQYQMAKLVESVVDYRLNRNGYAEVDVFLDSEEIGELAELRASPKRPVTLSADDVAALSSLELRRILEHLAIGMSESPTEIQLQSTFELEHAYSPQIAFSEDETGHIVFLVGDAAISLPFFRGMSALAGLVGALVHAHLDILMASTGPDGPEAEQVTRMSEHPSLLFHLGTKPLPGSITAIESTWFDGISAAVILHRWLGLYGVHVVTKAEDGWRSLHRHAPMRRARAQAEFAALADPASRYQFRGEQIRDDELRVVAARSRLIRGAREFARISALLPFPIQTWLLSIRSDEERSHSPSPLHISIAGIVALLVLIGPPLAVIDRALMVLWWLGLAGQVVGGFVYRASLTLDPAGEQSARRIWISQIAAVAAFGLVVALVVKITHDEWMLRSLVTWLLLGLAFVPGIYLFEAIDHRWFTAARLDSDL